MRKIIIVIKGFSLDAASKHLASFNEVEQGLNKFLIENKRNSEVEFLYANSSSEDTVVSFSYLVLDCDVKHCESTLEVRALFSENFPHLSIDEDLKINLGSHFENGMKQEVETIERVIETK